MTVSDQTRRALSTTRTVAPGVRPFSGVAATSISFEYTHG